MPTVSPISGSATEQYADLPTSCFARIFEATTDVVAMMAGMGVSLPERCRPEMFFSVRRTRRFWGTRSAVCIRNGRQDSVQEGFRVRLEEAARGRAR